MISLDEVLVDGSDWKISLTKLVRQPIKDIHCRLASEYGEPMVVMMWVEFEDGLMLNCEGEHDLPYLVPFGRDSVPNFDDDTLQALSDEEEARDG